MAVRDRAYTPALDCCRCPSRRGCPLHPPRGQWGARRGRGRSRRWRAPTSSLGVPLLYPLYPTTRTMSIDVVVRRHVEVARRIHREGTRTADLAEGNAIRGEHRPIPLGIALLDRTIGVGSAHDVEVAP